MFEGLVRFIPVKWKIRGEVKARGEGQLELGETSLTYWEDRLGWSSDSARYLATAFTFGVRENVAAVLEVAQRLDEQGDFEEHFVNRIQDDPSIIGAALDASKFTTAEELRDLLSRILVSDVRQPGSVSRRAVSIAENLSPAELQEFLKLRQVAWYVDEGQPTFALVVDNDVRPPGPHFLSFSLQDIKVSHYRLIEIQQVGLVIEHQLGTVLRPDSGETMIRLRYRDRTIELRHPDASPALAMGNFGFSSPGVEILGLFIDDAYPSLEGYFEEVCQRWREDGWEVSEMNE